MKENRDATDTNVATIEKDIINAQHFIDSIKTDKEYKEENGWHGYYNKEIVELARTIEHILLDYKRVLKENEQLSTEVNSLQEENEKLNKLHIQDNKHLDFIIKNSISIQKVKDKISERQFELQQEYKDFEDDSILIVLQELLEGRKENV